MRAPIAARELPPNGGDAKNAKAHSKGVTATIAVPIMKVHDNGPRRM